MKRLAIIGSATSGGAAQIIDAVLTGAEYKPVAIFDNNERLHGTCILNVPVVTSSERVYEFWKRNEFDVAIIAIGGNLVERQRLFDELDLLGIPFANVIDRSAKLRLEVKIGRGNVFLGNVFIGPNVTLGDNCYVITNTCINHDSKIGSHVYFSAGCTIAGNVEVGNRVRFDTASGAKAKISVKDDYVVPAGKILIDSP
jgi:sugar O-acyltransferase (sialic acid O-acetyltransferase NeuD family)